MGSIYHAQRTPSVPSGMLINLPFDLLHEVASYLDSKAAVLRLAQSASLFLCFMNLLSHDTGTQKRKQCNATLSMLCLRPDIARHVRKLVIRFSDSGSLDDGWTHSTHSSGIAEEIPQCDSMWFALRISCPQLRTIGISYGAELPKSHSHLFEFKRLRGFSLSLKRGFYEQYSDFDLRELPTDSQLWDMLIRRSPDLEELQIAGASFLPVHPVHPLCRARWPRLHTLSLGDILLDWQPRAGVKPPFIAFLEAHPHLRSLRTSRAALNPALLTSLARGSLPELRHFGGAIEHLQGLTNIHSQLTSVALDEPLIIRDLAPLLVAGVLQGLKSLTELRVCFVFHSAYESGSLVRSIANACPGLTTLEVICARRPSFTVHTFAKAIRTLPRLRHLRLTLVRSQHEDSLPVCATLITRTNHRLHTFSITFIPSTLPLPLSFHAEIGLTKGDPGHPYIQTGNYVVGSDEHGLPTTLTCIERRAVPSLHSSLPTLPIPLFIPTISFGGPPRTARQDIKKYHYTVDLRPGAKKVGGLRLLLERSGAGEEARVLLVLVSLTGLAIWGFFA
ncbi:hypothetical protein BU15DRAFT_88718 [Melanogaster broomeanus]|nr:hypothetical protein BU15DRAFT_88718 [Melanogaster broomeanus]